MKTTFEYKGRKVEIFKRQSSYQVRIDDVEPCASFGGPASAERYAKQIIDAQRQLREKGEK
jgi:hypothetical protein